MKKLIYGRGVNDVDFCVKVNGKHINSYKAWRSMFNRCYGNNDLPHIIAYKDAEVCKEWWSYSKFLEWYNDNYVEGYVLDKDICNTTGIKLYCPHNCSFVPQSLNNLISNGGVKNPKYPRGITKQKRGKKFKVTIGNGTGGSNKIGMYDTIDEAKIAYKTAKEAYVKEVATNYYTSGKINERVYQALMKYEVEITD